MSDDGLILLENMPGIPGLSFRHFRGEDDYNSMASVLTISQRADHYDRSVTAEDLAKAYANSLTNCDPFTDMIVAEVAGQMVGYVRGWWEQESPCIHLYKHNGVLLPAWRRKGLGRAMLNWVENRLKDIAEAQPRESKKIFRSAFRNFKTALPPFWSAPVINRSAIFLRWFVPIWKTFLIFLCRMGWKFAP